MIYKNKFLPIIISIFSLSVVAMTVDGNNTQEVFYNTDQQCNQAM